MRFLGTPKQLEARRRVMSRPRPSGAIGVLIAVTLAALPEVGRAQGMDTYVQGLEINQDECKSRVTAALSDHGYGNRRDFEHGSLAWTNDTSVSVICVQTPPAAHTVLVITTAGNGSTATRSALVARIVNPRIAAPAPAASSTAPAPPPSACGYLNGAPARPGDQAGVLVSYAQLPRAVEWVAVADPGGGHFPSMWFRPEKRPNGQWFLAGPIQRGRTYVLRAFDRNDQPLGECPFTR
jgi:hypothetical protein